MTDAEFLRFLRHGGSKIAVIVEIEYAYESAGTLATGTLYFSDCEDAVAGSQPYADVLVGMPEVLRAIDLQRLGGRGSRSVGALMIDNTGGDFTYLLDTIIDGRDVTVCIGRRGSTRSDYRQIAVASVARVSESGKGMITIELRDKNYLLDDTIIGSASAIGGKPKPIVLGVVKNFDITPYLFDTSSLKYYINDFALTSPTLPATGLVQDVRDAGASLLDFGLFTFSSATMTADAGTETLTYAGHGLSLNDVVVFRASGPGSLFGGLSALTQYWVVYVSGDDFRLSDSKGGPLLNITSTVMSGTWACDRQRFYIDAANAQLELSSPPEGRVTMDWTAVDFAGELLSPTPHRIFKYVLEHYTKLTAADFDETAIDDLADSYILDLYYGRAITDRVNVMDILDEIAAATLSWFGWRSDGVLTVGKLDLANLDSETPTDSVDEGDMGELSTENLVLPFGKITMDTDPNVVTQTDGIVASVSAEDRAKWAQRHQVRVSTTDLFPLSVGGPYLTNWWDYHKSAITSAPIPMQISTGDTPDPVNAQDLVDEMTELFRPYTRVHRTRVGLDKYALNPGDCILATHRRGGLSAGKNCRVVSVRVSDDGGAPGVDLVLVRQAIPDYTATH